MPTFFLNRSLALWWPWLVIAGFWAVVFVVYLVIGRKQRKEGGGSVVRWLWVSAAVAALAIAPCVVSTLAFGNLREAIREHEAAMLVPVISVMFMWRFLSPLRLKGGQRPIPLIDEEAFAARVHELATRLKIRTPRVHLLRSTVSDLDIDALAGGLPAPSLLVTDGVLYRLDPLERDGLVAHEMAHIANGSLWWSAMFVPAAYTAALLAAPYIYAWPLFGIVVYMGLIWIVGRLLELDCDRRAGNAVGHGAMASALRKVHAAHPIDSDLLSLLIHTTAMHPHLDTRLAALARSAPADEQSAISFDAGRVRRLCWASRLAVGIYLAALVAVLLSPRSAWGCFDFAVLGAVVLTPWVLLWIGMVPQLKLLKQRGGQLVSWGAVFRVLASVAGLGFLSALPAIGGFLMECELWTVCTTSIAAILVCFVVVSLRVGKTAELRKEVDRAFQRHEFERALELGEKSPKIVARNEVLRHNLALAAEICGRRDEAIAALEELRRDKPRLKFPGFVLAAIFLDDDQPDRALAIAEELAADLPDDPRSRWQAAAVLRRLGRLDEAEKAANLALRIEPESGEAYAVLAGIALDRGDLARARELVQDAQRCTPGDVRVRIVEAQMAIAAGSEAEARQAVEQAVSAIEANPIAILGREAIQLQKQLAERVTRPKE